MLSTPKTTELGLEEVEYVGHLVFAMGTLFTLEKRIKVLDFPQPTIQKGNHVSNMTDLEKPFRVIIPLGRHQMTGKLV
jgi:hypothetical protein